MCPLTARSRRWAPWRWYPPSSRMRRVRPGSPPGPASGPSTGSSGVCPARARCPWWELPRAAPPPWRCDPWQRHRRPAPSAHGWTCPVGSTRSKPRHAAWTCDGWWWCDPPSPPTACASQARSSRAARWTCWCWTCRPDCRWPMAPCCASSLPRPDAWEHASSSSARERSRPRSAMPSRRPAICGSRSPIVTGSRWVVRSWGSG